VIEGDSIMMPISEINIGDIFSNPFHRGYGNLSGLEWLVTDINKPEKMILIQGVKYSDKTFFRDPIWKKNTDRMFAKSWRIFKF